MKKVKLKLSTKFVLFSMLSFSIAFTSIVVYFYFYVQDEEQLKIKNNAVKIFQNITQDIQNIQNNLIKQTNFLDQDESLLASIYFINTYEHSQDYEKALIDEEKKAIADALFKRAKFAFNDTLLLYVKDQSIAVGVERVKHKYTKFFSSYAKDQKLYYSMSEMQERYALDKRINQKYNIIHKKFYNDSPHAKPQITFNLNNNHLIITAHHSLFEDNQSVAHIEISKYFNMHSLKAYPAYDTLQLTQDKNMQSIAVDRKHLKDVEIMDKQNHYLSALKLATLDGNLYIKFTQAKIDLMEIIKSGSNSFLTMLAIIAFIFVVIMYAFYHLVLIRPLGRLMENIQYIKNREFQYLHSLHCGDELEEIARNIDHLAHSVQAKEKQLQDIAEHDSLTGLYNRYYFNNILNEKTQKIQEGHSLALIFIDVDEFKAINDTLGHDIGDGLIISIATRLNQFISSKGYLSRIGGDEFMIIVPNISHHDALYAFAHALHKLFDQPFIINTHYLNVTISSGIVLSKERNKSINTLYKEADIALYKSKDRGRNRYTLYQEEFAQEINEYNAILNALKNALNHQFDEFYLVYQPKISTHDGYTLNGVEALIRWDSEELGTIPPDTFIKIAEESGVIIELGYWIIEQACRDFLTLQQQNINLKQMSINISAIQFASHNFLDKVALLIKTIGIAPSFIEFELTERILAKDDQKILLTLNTLRKLGIHIAIDDFGTGYSSLSYLQKLPVNRLKIDKSFVTNIDTTGPLEIVEQAIMPLARAFHLSTTAEGVETQGEYEVLKKIGVDDIQGYYFSKPLTIEKLTTFVKKLNS